MNRKELVSRLDLVGRALADSNIIPAFQCFCFDKTTVKAYNDSLGVIAPCETKEAFAVHGSTLSGLVSKSHSETVEFALTDKNNLTVKAGRSTFKLPWYPAEDFLFEEPKDKWALKFPLNEALIEGLSACLMTSSKDYAQAAFMGVCLMQREGTFFLYSSNGDAISRYTLAKTKATEETSYMLPNAFCEALIKITADTEATSGTVEVSEGWAKATLNTGYVIYGRLIIVDNKLDYGGVIKRTVKKWPEFTEIPKDFDQALDRARVIADPESAKTVLTVEANRLKLLTQTNMGTVKDTLAFEHPEVEAAVSAELVQRCVSLSAEMAVLENCVIFKDGEKLLILTSNMGE